MSDEAIGMAFGALGIGCTIFIWAGVMPQMLDAFVISTSVSINLIVLFFADRNDEKQRMHKSSCYATEK